MNCISSNFNSLFSFSAPEKVESKEKVQSTCLKIWLCVKNFFATIFYYLTCKQFDNRIKSPTEIKQPEFTPLTKDDPLLNKAVCDKAQDLLAGGKKDWNLTKLSKEKQECVANAMNQATAQAVKLLEAFQHNDHPREWRLLFQNEIFVLQMQGDDGSSVTANLCSPISI